MCRESWSSAGIILNAYVARKIVASRWDYNNRRNCVVLNRFRQNSESTFDSCFRTNSNLNFFWRGVICLHQNIWRHSWPMWRRGDIHRTVKKKKLGTRWVTTMHTLCVTPHRAILIIYFKAGNKSRSRTLKHFNISRHVSWSTIQNRDFRDGIRLNKAWEWVQEFITNCS